MRSSIRVRLLAGYTGVVLLLLLAWASAAIGTGALRASYAHTVDTTDALVANVVNLEKLTDDQETGLRGYLLTRQSDFLQPYKAGRAAAPALYERTAALAAGEPGVLPLLTAMRQRALAWRQWASSAVRRAGAVSPSSAAGVAEQRAGKALFDRYRAASTRVVSYLNGARQRDLESSLNTLGRMNDLFALIFATAIGIGGVLGWLAVRAVTRPLERLERAAQTIGHGDLSRPVCVEGSREFARLARSMDWMRRQLDESHAELVEEKRALEHTSAALAHHAAELERSNGELEQFAYVASHDLQEPLRTIASYVQLLGRRYQGRLDADADEFIAYAAAGAARLQTLINDLLAYSRVGTRGQPLAPTPCAAAVAAAQAALAAAIRESEAQITVGALPLVAADAGQLTQLFQNLLANALKFRRPGTAPVVSISAARVGREWHIAVRDAGIGLDPAYAARIFEIFQRLHTRDEYEGTGIGLAICKKIAERHGGRLWVASQPGAGATFTLALPACDDEALGQAAA